MYFCPKCNYSFDIAKSSKTTDDRKKLDNPIELLKRLKAKKNLSNYNHNIIKILFDISFKYSNYLFNKFMDHYF